MKRGPALPGSSSRGPGRQQPLAPRGPRRGAARPAAPRAAPCPPVPPAPRRAGAGLLPLLTLLPRCGVPAALAPQHGEGRRPRGKLPPPCGQASPRPPPSAAARRPQPRSRPGSSAPSGRHLERAPCAAAARPWGPPPAGPGPSSLPSFPPSSARCCPYLGRGGHGQPGSAARDRGKPVNAGQGSASAAVGARPRLLRPQVVGSPREKLRAAELEVLFPKALCSFCAPSPTRCGSTFPLSSPVPSSSHQLKRFFTFLTKQHSSRACGIACPFPALDVTK